MQLGASPAPSVPPVDLAAALAGATERLGHRPAVTQLLPSGRQEQSVASLAQWASKGAHFLQLELDLQPGDVMGLSAPPGWTAAAVALAAWWAGIAVDPTPDADHEVTVVHLPTSPGGAPGTTSGSEVFWLGDGIDGAPTDAPGTDGARTVGTATGDPDRAHAGDLGGEAWVRAVQSFPDQPPPPQATASGPAVLAGGRPTTHQELLALAATHGRDGTLGLDGAGTDATLDLALVAVRPLLVGRPTVVCRGVDRSAADGERVARWR